MLVLGFCFILFSKGKSCCVDQVVVPHNVPTSSSMGSYCSLENSQCGCLKENATHWLTGSGTIGRCGLAGVGVTLLKWAWLGWSKHVTQFPSCCLLILMENSQLLLQHLSACMLPCSPP